MKLTFDDNPLRYTWSIISTIVGVISLVSFTQNLILWKDFFPSIIFFYEILIYTPFEFLNLNWNERVIDYFVFGSLCGLSFTMALGFAEKENLISKITFPKSLRIFYFLLYFFFWPLGIIITIFQAIGISNNKDEIKIKRNFLSWLISIFLIFLFAAIINSIL